MVENGDVRRGDLIGNDRADAAADLGRLRQQDGVISAGRALIRARRLWYPIMLDWHKFVVVISRIEENHDGYGSTSPEFFRLLDLPVSEQVIEVPGVSSSSCPSRAVLKAPQVVEQLVEVPTIVSYSSLQQRSAEQIVDTPVPRGRCRRRQGFSPWTGFNSVWRSRTR